MKNPILDHLDLSLYVHDLEIPAFQHNYNEIGKRRKEVQYLRVFVWNMGHEHFRHFDTFWVYTPF